MRSPTQLPRPSSQNRLIGQQLSLDSVLVDDSRQHPHMQHAVRIYHGSGFAEQDQLEATRQQQQQDWGSFSDAVGGGQLTIDFDGSVRSDGMPPPAWAQQSGSGSGSGESSSTNTTSAALQQHARSLDDMARRARVRLNLPPVGQRAKPGSYHHGYGGRDGRDGGGLAKAGQRSGLSQPRAGVSVGHVRGLLVARQALIAKLARDAELKLARLERSSRHAPVGDCRSAVAATD
jgi:hypothetical protein